MSVYVNNITVNTGEYFSRDFYLDNLDGSPLDLTGYSGSSQIRKHANSLNPTATFTLTFVDRSNGRIRVALASTITTTIKPGRYVYDILFTDDTGKKSVVIEGNILATADVSLGCTFPEFQGGGGSGGGGSGEMLMALVVLEHQDKVTQVATTPMAVVEAVEQDIQTPLAVRVVALTTMVVMVLQF